MIVAVEGSTRPEFEALLDLAHRLFPPELLEPDDELREEADGRSRIPYRYFVWVDQAVAGFVRFARLPMDIGFIVHLGVAPERQGNGIGVRLLRAATEAMGTEVVVAEVEEGDSLRWWLRQGAEVVSSTYTQPPLHPDTPPMALDFVARGPWREIPDLVPLFYAEVWQRTADDPIVKRAVGR